MKDEIKQKVFKVISDQLNVDINKMSDNMSLDELGGDSLDQIEILMTIEELFNIEISDDEANTLTNVQDFIDVVKLHTKE